MYQRDSAAAGTVSRIWRVAFVSAAAFFLLPEVAAWAQQAQRKTVPATQANATVYTYVERMPELPGGGGMPAVAACLMRHFHPTAHETRAATGGSFVIEFVVTASGAVTQTRIVRSGGADIDAVALRAIKTLPRFHHGQQGGIPVSVKLLLPVSCLKFQ